MRGATRHEAKPDDNRRVPELEQRGKPTPSGQPVLPAASAESGRSRHGSGNAALVLGGGLDAARTARCRVGRGLPEDQELGADRKGSPIRHRKKVRAGGARKGFQRGVEGRQRGVAGGADSLSKLPRSSVGVARRKGLVERRQRQRQGQRTQREGKVRYVSPRPIAAVFHPAP